MNGYFQDGKGNKSSTRLIGFIVVMYALFESSVVLVFGFIEKSAVMLSAAAAGTLFITIAGPVLVYLFKNKTEELTKANEPTGNIK